jgi:23S rRNA pseudouridine1911/1915/1917 synthase
MGPVNSPVARSVRFEVTDRSHAGMRLDRYLAEVGKLGTRSQLNQRCRRLAVNGRTVKPSYRVQTADVVECELAPPSVGELEPEPVPFVILYRDERVMVIDKPQGLVVHPGAGHRHGTLVHGLLHELGTGWFGSVGATGDDESGSDNDESHRPGIVHRLDKETSGVMVVAMDVETHAFLVEQFAARTVIKQYVAIVKGRVASGAGTVDLPIGRDPRHRTRFKAGVRSGKPAVTGYRCLRRYRSHSLVLLKPETGRTHQLRVHMKSIGHPIVGDSLYGRRDATFPAATLLLHALRLTIRTASGNPPTTFRAPVPDHFRRVLTALHRE